jgi:hypothetical protein
MEKFCQITRREFLRERGLPEHAAEIANLADDPARLREILAG